MARNTEDAKPVPAYTVVRVDRQQAAEPGAPLSPGDTLHVLAVGVEHAGGPLGAADAVAGDDAIGEFGGFLTRYLKSDEWIEETYTRRGRRGVLAPSERPAESSEPQLVPTDPEPLDDPEAV